MKIDEDRSDVARRYLREAELFKSEESSGCVTIAQELSTLDALYEPDLVERKGLASPLRVGLLGGLLPDPTFPNSKEGKEKEKLLKDVRKLIEKRRKEAGALGLPVGAIVEDTLTEVAATEKKLKSDKHAGHDHGDKAVKDMAKRIEYREDFLELCEPVQTLRVAEACSQARNNGISLIAINLSGQDKIASNTTDMCINHSVLDDIETKKKGGKKNEPAPNADPDGNALTLPSGIKVRVSADGQSFAGDANNLEELRDMLGVMLPDSKQTRSVRLVH
jgi:hypothetical protein